MKNISDESYQKMVKLEKDVELLNNLMNESREDFDKINKLLATFSKQFELPADIVVKCKKELKK